MRSGNVNPANTAGTFRNAGIEGQWWSSRAYSSATNAYDLNFNTTVNPSNSGNRYVGRSLRCLDGAAVRCRSFFYDLCFLEIRAIIRVDFVGMLVLFEKVR